MLDNASSHKKDNLTIPSNIVLIYLPPNCTSLFQPLDLGIIHSFKAIYIDLLRNQYYMEFLKAGNWSKSNNKDAIINIVSASQKLTTDTVINCWKKSTLLSSHFDFKKLILEENFKHGTLDWKIL